jgi:hypothetical protein
MNRSTRTYKILLTIALIACVVVIVAEFHRHTDDAQGCCWLCVSSFASTALPALTGLVLFSWTWLGQVFAAPILSHPQTTAFALCARAPPRSPYILSF